ncbi:MAG: serine/threonine-protein kinase [Sandaracinus sp.]
MDDEAWAPTDAAIAGRYRVVRRIGAGGAGVVLEVDDNELGTRVALKLVRGDAWDAAAVASLKREIQLARRVTHPNVCRTFDLGTHVDAAGIRRPFLTMELVEGETLAARLRRDGRLSLDETLRIGRGIAAALDAAHAVGVVHRDLGARNVLLSGERVVVSDFGLALDAGAGHVGPYVGTPTYMAPEQVAGGEVTRASDVYALGVLLMQMATGRLPFEAATPREAADQRLHAPPLAPRAALASIPARWNRVILRCLARAPAERFASAGAAVRALEAPDRRRVAVGIALVVLLAISAGGYAWWASRARAGRVAELVAAAAASQDFQSAETLAREAHALDPSSRPARAALAHALFDRSRLAPSGRAAALAEGRALAEGLVAEDPSDPAGHDQLVTALYFGGDRLGALEQLAFVPEARRLQVAPRIEWTLGWLELARRDLARCLETLPDDVRCRFIEHYEIELTRGEEGIAAVLASGDEHRYTTLARVRMRLLLGRIDEASLVSETGFATGTLDALDAPYLDGWIAASRGNDDAAARAQADLDALVRGDDAPVAIRYAGAVQLAELAARRHDVEGAVRAATLAVELGFWDAELWERGLSYASMRVELAPVAARARALSAQALAEARARGLARP